MSGNEIAQRIADLESDNARLRRLLDQSGAPAELRHRLNSTLAMLRVIIRKSMLNRRDIDEYAAHLEDRVDALARTQSAADEHGSVDLLDLVADQLQIYRENEGDRLTISGPAVQLRPRAGQVFGLALHELAVNALEHGALGSGSIEVTWQVTANGDGPELEFSWIERGASAIAEAGPPGFGTEVLTATLAYELDATTEMIFEPAGLTCRIRFPLSDRTGELGGD